MRYYCHGGNPLMVAPCIAVLNGRGWIRAEYAGDACVAIAPALRRILGADELGLPELGTLVFHPSLLPRRRGPDAVKWQVLGGDEFGGVSWFWADEGLDTGDVCEQEVVGWPLGTAPRVVYADYLVPAGLRCLERVAHGLERGVIRRVRQDDLAATYDSWHPETLRRRSSQPDLRD